MQIDAQTRFFLLLGNPVAHSLSPALHNAAFRALQLNYVYLAAPVAPIALAEAMAGMKALGIAGANITSPYKEAVLPFLDEIDPEAALIKSVNTIVNRQGRLCGGSTDGAGLWRHLETEGLSGLIKDTVLVIGAGGVARAVAYDLAGRGTAEIVVVNRTPGRAGALTELLLNHTALEKAAAVLLDREGVLQSLRRCRLIIFGLPEESPLLIKTLRENSALLNGKVLIDLRYHPAETELMHLFASHGGRVYNGKGMLLWQAVEAFERFTGRSAPVESMRRVIEETSCT